MKLGPIPPAPPDLTNMTATQAQISAGLRLNTGQPANPAVPTASPVPCPKCRDKGWVFVSILDGTTRRCDCDGGF